MDDGSQTRTQQTQTDPLSAWPDGLRFGEPVADGALALAPVYADEVPNRLHYRTLVEDLAR